MYKGIRAIEKLNLGTPPFIQRSCKVGGRIFRRISTPFVNTTGAKLNKILLGEGRGCGRTKTIFPPRFIYSDDFVRRGSPTLSCMAMSLINRNEKKKKNARMDFGNKAVKRKHAWEGVK